MVAFAAMSLIFFVSLAPSPALADVGNCVESGCGDGIVSPQFSETCDDGNALGGDGCSSEVQTSPLAISGGIFSFPCRA